MAGTRVFVQDQIYDQFVEKAVKLAQNKKIGDPFDQFVENGPLMS